MIGRFMYNLTQRGFFEGTAEGSIQYQQRYEQVCPLYPLPRIPLPPHLRLTLLPHTFTFTFTFTVVLA